MPSKSESKIYDNETFFAPYLKATDEKITFVNFFAEQIAPNTKCDSLVDVGCFNGSLTIPLAAKLLTTGHKLKSVTGVEPSLSPLETFEAASKPEMIKWIFLHATAEEFANQSTAESYDWLIASHSLYWSGSQLKDVIENFRRISKRAAIVVRDEGFLHQFEIRHRPKIVHGKTFVSSAEVTQALSALGINYSRHKMNSKMNVPPVTSPEFKNLIGFLLDLTESQLSESLMADVRAELASSQTINAGIDVIWW